VPDRRPDPAGRVPDPAGRAPDGVSGGLPGGVPDPGPGEDVGPEPAADSRLSRGAGRAADGPGPGRAADGPVTLLLWRHGQTDWNLERRFQGQSDVGLNATGRRQAERAARLIAALRPDAIYSSDLDRAASTADPLARLTGLPVNLDKDLRERHGGRWEGLTDTEIRQFYPDEYQIWSPPQGEATAAVADRAGEAFERIADSLPGGSLAVIVSHGAAIGLGLSRLLGLPETERVIGPLANCSWSLLGHRSGRWRLLEHNVGTLPEPVPDAGPAVASRPAPVRSVAAGAADSS
jgi:glucosyl-3-phosphoglycerate phosphatase